MLRDLLVVRERPQLGQGEIDRIVDEPGDAQPVRSKVGVEQFLVFIGVGVLAVVPEVRRDVLLGVLTRCRVHMFEEPLSRADQREADPLHDARMTQRERRRRDPADDAQDHRCRENSEADPTVVVAAGVDVVEVVEQPGGEHERHVHDDEPEEPDQHHEVQ